MAGNGETLRKILLTSLGTVLMTEEGVIKHLSELKLPREAKNYLVKQAQKRKSDLANIIVSELKGFLGRINIHEELHKALQGLKIDVAATIHIDRSGPILRTTKTRISKDSTKKVTRRTK